MQHGWRVFLVKVANEAGVTAPLRVSAAPTPPSCTSRRAAMPAPPQSITPQDASERWLDVDLVNVATAE